MPSVKVVNGKQIVVENLGPIERLFSFIVKPFVRMLQHRDLIAAILRREVRERFKGSIAGWIWAIIAPLLMIAVYALMEFRDIFPKGSAGRDLMKEFHFMVGLLILALVVKEVPFLLLMILSALPQTDAARRMMLCRTLGYGRVHGFALTVLPALYPQLRLLVYAVLAYAMTSVETALILGEFYRRQGEWKFRCVAQGFAGGLEPLAKHFGVVRALDGVDFDVPAGQCVALIGPNGAGKSTCFACLAGQQVPTAGEVLWQGQSLLGKPPAERQRLGVARTFQVAQTFEALTVLQNIQLVLRGAAPLAWWDRLDRRQPERALQAIDKGLALAPDAIELKLTRAHTLVFLGRFDEAEREMDACMRRVPEIGFGWWTLSRLRKQRPDANHVDALRAQISQSGHNPANLAFLAYALHKELDDLGDTAPMLAALLDWPQAMSVNQLALEDGGLRVHCDGDQGLEQWRLPLPAVLGVDLRLCDPRAISLEDLQNGRIDVDVASAKLQSACAELNAAESDLARIQLLIDRLTVKSPRDGTILQVNIRAGEFPPPEPNGVCYLKIPLNSL
mgnify:CR=1 FL=1